MMPSVALDVHLPHALTDALTRSGVDAVHLAHWGDLRTASDEAILAATTTAGRVFITRDASTVPSLANRWVDDGRQHAGVLLVSKRIAMQDIGGMLAAILHELRRDDSGSFANLVRYARSPG
jgi:predicted nuclease of predicted toxin-antitoxin system